MGRSLRCREAGLVLGSRTLLICSHSYKLGRDLGILPSQIGAVEGTPPEFLSARENDNLQLQDSFDVFFFSFKYLDFFPIIVDY